ncbi:YczE/YyaS/YitT family protein [Paenibacillus tengchongensis]|uniref:YczE/YyaS/YitT family protein n=1 Tax=Paenibacillus tengchongensis TaxID=2608684 RepID=UPI001FE8AB72|nr:YitT family protein [Paenibacillus tengchongensis]
MPGKRLRGGLYITGILLLALGIALTIVSGLGTSPFDALLVGLAQNVGLTVGSWEMVLAAVMLLGNALLARSRPLLLGIVTSVITGLSIDLWMLLLGDFLQPVQLAGRLACLAAGLVVTGLGTAVYLQARFAPTPLDHLMLLLQEQYKLSLLSAKTLIYAVYLALAWLFDGPIGIGTLLSVAIGGLLLQLFMPLIGKRLEARPAGNTA